MTPQQAADAALSAIAPTTKVSTDGTAVVAGRNAYELVLQPKDAVRWWSRCVSRSTARPTYRPGSRSLPGTARTPPSRSASPRSTRPLRTPPRSASTHPQAPRSPRGHPKSHEALPSDEKALRSPADQASSATKPKIVGTGWTTVVVARLPAGATSGAGQLSRMLRRPAQGEWHLGLWSPVEGHLVLGAAHRRRPGGRGRGGAGGAVRGTGQLMSEVAVATSGLTKRFGHQVAVDSLDLVVPTGSVYGFLGPNGSGKTTTIRMLLGLVRPTSGSVELLGRAMPADGPRRTRESRFTGRGAGVPPLPVRPGQPGQARVRRPYRRTPGPREPGSTGPWTGSVCWPPPPSATAPTRWACASGWPSPARCCGTRDLLVLDEPTNGLDPQGTREVSDSGRVAGRRGRHRAGLEPPALRGRADVHPPRRDARREAGRPGHQRRGEGRHRGRGERRDRPAAGSGPHHARARAHGGAHQPRLCHRPARRGSHRRRSSRRASTRACPVLGFRVGAPSLEDVFVSLTGEGFDVSG